MPGYPDFRRQQDYDSFPAFVSLDTQAQNGTVQHGPFYVGLWHAIGVKLFVDLDKVKVTVVWFTDATMATELGERVFVVDPAVFGPCQMRLVNLGPYVRITCAPLAAGNWDETIVMWPTNRVFPTEFVPLQNFLVDDQPGALAAAATSTAVFLDYFAGPATWRVAAGVAPGTFQLQSLTVAGAWTTFASRLLLAGVQEDVAVTIPPGACRSQITNTGGVAGSFGSVVTPSITGG